MTDHKNKAGQHKIAIVGTGILSPGALSAKEFWLNILAEKDFIKTVPPSHWLVEDYYAPVGTQGDKVYCRKGAFLDDIAFDPVEFGMPPNLLATTDTVQLLSLLVARDTLADTVSFQAGKVDPKKTSVILGVAGGTELIGQMSARIHTPEWIASMRRQGLPESKIDAILADIDQSYTQWTENTFPGLLGNVVSGRIANRFDLKGTNCVLDAACASSLAAVKMAIQELQLGTTDMVITGGADALNDIFMFMCFSKTTALSPTEDCRPFSDQADGTIIGEAIAMLALKRLADAEREGDRIYAVISSIGSSSDGKSGSIYAPDSNGQALAIRSAYEQAGCTPDDISLVEAHGTGTIAGDSAEFSGLRVAYGETQRQQYCALGSVKSMIGHTKSAAGAVNLLKVAMALGNRVLPPSIKIERPNPKLDIENSPFYLNTVARPWIHTEAVPRRAAVSSMGFGGTNFHVALEEYVPAQIKKVYRAQRELVLLSAATPAQLVEAANALVSGSAERDLVALAQHSQRQFDPAAPCRLALLGDSLADIAKWAQQAVAQIGAGKTRVEVGDSLYYSAQPAVPGKLAFLFSGQGSQYVDMGRDLLMQFDDALAPWNKAAALTLDDTRTLDQVVYPIPAFSEPVRQEQAARLVRTEWAQPAIGTLALSHLNLLAKLNVAPDMAGGHSYGELAALHAAGVITSAEDLIRTSRKRGELMAAAASGVQGAMTAVFADAARVEALLSAAGSRVVVANINSPTQSVISGELADVEAIEQALGSAGLRFQRLNVATAFHSALVADSAAAFETYLKNLKFAAPAFPVYCNTTAAPYAGKPASVAATLAHQLAAPVRFVEQVQAMYKAGARVFLEVGPGKALGNFVKDILGEQPHTAISLDGGRAKNSKNAFWAALGQLSVAGVPVAYEALWQNIDTVTRDLPARKPSAATVQINGANYGRPYPPRGGAASLPKPNPETVAAPTPAPQDRAPTPQRAAPSTPPKDTMSMPDPEWLNAFHEIQKNTLDAQKKFQETLAESHRLFLETSQLAFQQLGRHTGSIDAAQPAATGLAARLQPAPPLSVAPPAPVAAAASPAVQVVAPANIQQPPAATASHDLAETLIGIVADKTGYPREILDLSTNLEAELGIDSIKRVEILSAMQATFPALQSADKGRLAAMNTLGEIIAYAQESGAAAAPQVAAGAVSATGKTVTLSDNHNIEAALIRIVAEKTGYPTEILDLSTNLEAELGIDSIKRVEILSAMQNEFPVLQSADKGRLAAMNTLGEIVGYAREASGSTAPPAVTAPAAVRPAPQPQQAGADLEAALIRIVAEKTGYPPEILNLSTDLEAELGIDSIKRVEILSAVQSAFPEFDGVDKGRLAAAKTLGEILALHGKRDIGSVASPEVAAASPTTSRASSAPAVYRQIVVRRPIANQGFAAPTWQQAPTLYLLKDDSGIHKHLAKLFRSVGANPSAVDTLPEDAACVIDLRGLNRFADNDRAGMLAANAAAFSLARRCGRNAPGKPGCLILAYDNGLAEGKASQRAWLGGIGALAKTASLEWPHAHVQAINLDTSARKPEQTALALFRAITGGGSAPEIEIDAEDHILEFQTAAAEIVGHTHAFKPGDTLVVSGGARGVTAACLIALTRRTKLNIAILGRTQLSDEPAYLAGCGSDAELKTAIVQHARQAGQKIAPADVGTQVAQILANREIRDNLRRLSANGAAVRYLAVDVADRDATLRAIAQVRAEFGSIQGLVHAAGILADKLIHEKTDEQFDRVFRTKIDGFINLLDATANDRLSHICCFSSVAARMGNVGQVDYAMANEVLNKVCRVEQARRGDACQVKSINWGPWEGGMVTPPLKKHFAALGVELIPIERGAEFFADEMEATPGDAVEIVVSGNLDRWGALHGEAGEQSQYLWLHQSNNSYLDSHRIEGKVIVPMMMATEWGMRVAKSLYPQLRIVETRNLKVYKGIHLDKFDTTGNLLRFAYTAQHEGDNARVDIRILGEQGEPYYELSVGMAAKAGSTPQASWEVDGLDAWQLDKGDIYPARLFHGPDFQVIDELQGISDKACAGTLKLDNPDVINGGQWQSDAFLFDGGIQFAILAIEKWTGNNSSLPLGYESLRLHNANPPTRQMRCELSLRNKGSMDSEWDIRFKTPDQQILAEITGLRLYMHRPNAGDSVESGTRAQPRRQR